MASSERLVSRRQGELDVNLSVSFGWFPIQGIGFVAPLSYGIRCRLGQHGMAAYHVQAVHGSIFPNYHLQHHRPLNARLPGRLG